MAICERCLPRLAKALRTAGHGLMTWRYATSRMPWLGSRCHSSEPRWRPAEPPPQSGTRTSRCWSAASLTSSSRCGKRSRRRATAASGSESRRSRSRRCARCRRRGMSTSDCWASAWSAVTWPRSWTRCARRCRRRGGSAASSRNVWSCWCGGLSTRRRPRMSSAVRRTGSCEPAAKVRCSLAVPHHWRRHCQAPVALRRTPTLWRPQSRTARPTYARRLAASRCWPMTSRRCARRRRCACTWRPLSCSSRTWCPRSSSMSRR
mmetsp:Transcript_75967/g.195723  ORF Transcript_75967/g.195723 Transcript_75967/m.195723 type:complete len:263 (+) Transcript_75967:352-1140(+)